MRRRLISRLGNGFLLPLARFCALVGAEPPAPLGAPERKIGTARSGPAAQRWRSRNVAIANVSDRAPHCLESKKELEFSSGASFNADSISIGWLRAITGSCRFPSSEARTPIVPEPCHAVATGCHWLPSRYNGNESSMPSRQKLSCDNELFCSRVVIIADIENPLIKIGRAQITVSSAPCSDDRTPPGPCHWWAA